MSTRKPDDWKAAESVIGGIALLFAGVVATSVHVVGVRVRIGDYELLSVVAAAAAIGLGTRGLYAATRGQYRVGVSSLVGAAGFTLLFLAPLARSAVLFAVVGSLFLVLSGLFLIATGFGYVVVVDDTDHDGTEADEASAHDRET